MRRIALIAALLAAAAGGVATVAGADDTHTYKLEMYDAFGLVPDAEVKVAGVTAGKITDLDINEDKRALVTVELTGPLAVLGDETECKSEPQSLIAEYFLDCQPAGDGAARRRDGPEPGHPDRPERPRPEHAPPAVQAAADRC